MGKILVTPRSLTKDGDPALELLKETGHEVLFCTPGKQPDEEELLRLVPGCLGWLAGVEKITPRVLEAARGLKAISRNGTGVDNVDLAACQRLGIAVLRAEGPMPGAWRSSPSACCSRWPGRSPSGMRR